MSFHCKVKRDLSLTNVIRRMAESSDPTRGRLATDALQRIESRSYFFIPAFVDVLRDLPKSWRGRTGTTPFEGELIWVDGSSRRSAHVRRPAGSAKGQTGEHQKSEEHEWLQVELCDLAYELGEDAEIEFPLHGGRVDVAWLKSKIAWEVDLSLPNRTEQTHRKDARERAGFRLISIMDGVDCKESLLEFPSVVVHDLKVQARQRHLATNRLPNFFVNSVVELAEGSLSWQPRNGLQLRAFCTQLIRGEWQYEQLPEPLHIRGFVYENAWRRSEDLARHREACCRKQKADAECKTATEQARRRDAELRALEEELKRSTAESLAFSRALANLRTDATEVERLDLKIAGTRRQFAAFGAKSEGREFTNLQQLVTQYDRQWFRRLFGGNKELVQEIESSVNRIRRSIADQVDHLNRKLTERQGQIALLHQKKAESAGRL